MNLEPGDELVLAPTRTLTVAMEVADGYYLVDSMGGTRFLSLGTIDTLLDSGIAEHREGVNFNRYPVGTVLGFPFSSATKISESMWVVTNVNTLGEATGAFRTGLAGIIQICRASTWEEIYNPDDDN